MKATFLVEVDTDSTDLLLEAEDVKSSLEEHGFEVLSCKPWSRPSLSSLQAVRPDAQPNT